MQSQQSSRMHELLLLLLQVKFNPGRADNMIIQSIALLDQMDKDINTFAMRVREWYSWHFPELKDIVKDNFLFAKCASYIKVIYSFYIQSMSSQLYGIFLMNRTMIAFLCMPFQVAQIVLKSDVKIFNMFTTG